VTVVVAVGAPVIVRIVGGAALEPATAVFRIQSIAMGLVFPVFAIGAALLVLHRHRDLLLANGLALAVALVAALALVPDHGARGAAPAAVIAESVLLLAQGYALSRAFSAKRAGEPLAEAPAVDVGRE
jgi:O-antigen/teichoic acid export membrane protein